MYISILEEAVQLKADEINVSGHAELLIVLAELRNKVQQHEDMLNTKDEFVKELEKQNIELNITLNSLKKEVCYSFLQYTRL